MQLLNKHNFSRYLIFNIWYREYYSCQLDIQNTHIGTSKKPDCEQSERSNQYQFFFSLRICIKIGNKMSSAFLNSCPFSPTTPYFLKRGFLIYELSPKQLPKVVGPTTMTNGKNVPTLISKSRWPISCHALFVRSNKKIKTAAISKDKVKDMAQWKQNLNKESINLNFIMSYVIKKY